MKEESNFEASKQAEILKKALKGASTTTTDSLCRIRGFTIDLLFLLRYGARRSHELAKATGKNSRYVNIYLKRMWIYGLVEKQRLFWKLTPLGLDLYDYFNNNIILTNKQIRTISNKDKLTYKQHKGNRRATLQN